MLYLLKTLSYIDVLVATGLLVFRWALIPRLRPLISSKLAVIVLTTPVIALFSHNVYVFFLYLVIVVAFNSRSRLELAGVFLFILPSVPLLPIQTGIAGTYLFEFSTVAAMGLGALLGTLVTRQRASQTLVRYDAAAWFLVILFVFIDNRFASTTVILRSLALQILLLIAPYLLIVRAARSPADIEQLLLRWSLGATVMAVTACFQSWRHWVLYEGYSGALHVPLLNSAATSLRAGLLQTGGSMINYSAGGLLLAAVIVVMPLLRRAFHTFGFCAVLALLVAGLFVTQSRGAWFAAIAGWAFITLWQRRWGRLAFIAVGALGFQAVFAFLPATGKIAQLLGKSGHAHETATYRQNLAAQGLEQVKNHPLFGQPTLQLIQNLSDLTQGEHIVDFVNSHLYVAMTAGVPLLMLWFAIWIMPVADGFRQNRQVSIFAAPIGIVVSTFVALTFTSLVDRNLTWLVVALALSVPCVLMRRAHPKDSGPPPKAYAGNA